MGSLSLMDITTSNQSDCCLADGIGICLLDVVANVHHDEVSTFSGDGIPKGRRQAVTRTIVVKALLRVLITR